MHVYHVTELRAGEQAVDLGLYAQLTRALQVVLGKLDSEGWVGPETLLRLARILAAEAEAEGALHYEQDGDMWTVKPVWLDMGPETK